MFPCFLFNSTAFPFSGNILQLHLNNWTLYQEYSSKYYLQPSPWDWRCNLSIIIILTFFLLVHLGNTFSFRLVNYMERAVVSAHCFSLHSSLCVALLAKEIFYLRKNDFVRHKASQKWWRLLFASGLPHHGGRYWTFHSKTPSLNTEEVPGKYKTPADTEKNSHPCKTNTHFVDIAVSKYRIFG